MLERLRRRELLLSKPERLKQHERDWLEEEVAELALAVLVGAVSI